MRLLEVVSFDFRFRARTRMRMPSYMGSAWRGGFGRALKRAVCLTGLPVCPGCPFEANCVYPYLFETAPGGEGGVLAGYDRMPNPFVLAPPWEEGRVVPEERETGLRLTRIGRSIEHADFARQAVVEAGLRGLGPDRGVLDFLSMDPITPPPAGHCPDRVEITLLTPLRLVEAGRLVALRALRRPRHFLLAVLRRVSALAERHGPVPLDLDYRALKECADTAEFAAAELRWVDWARWSGRQQALIRMGGLLGTLSLPLAVPEPFWPFLAFAPWVHVGKGATMGLGAVRVEPA